MFYYHLTFACEETETERLGVYQDHIAKTRLNKNLNLEPIPHFLQTYSVSVLTGVHFLPRKH